jgi:hypothetical protein
MEPLANRGKFFTRVPNQLRAEAQVIAHKQKKEFLEQGKTPNAANAIIQSELESNFKYNGLFKNYDKEDWKKFLQIQKIGKTR